jgi:hypothetical protein
VTAQLAYDSGPDDPVAILRTLPAEYHEQFRAEYAAAVEGARRPEQFRRLHELLRQWRLRAAAYSSPGYAGRLASAPAQRDAVAAAQVIPGGSDGHQRQ